LLRAGGATPTAVVAHTGTSSTGVYPTVLGRAFDALHPHVREAHVAPLHARGAMNVEHGSHRMTRLLVGLMGVLVERRGPGTIVYALREQGGSLLYEQKGMQAFRR